MPQIICKDLHLKCFKRRRAQELTDANCAARMKCAKLLLQKFCSMPLTLFSLRTKRCSRSLHLTVGRTKSVTDCGGNFWRRSLAFSSVLALRGLPLPGRLLGVGVSRNFLNSLLTPSFVQLFSGNSSVNLFGVYLFKNKLFIKILTSSFNTMLTVDKRCSDVAVCCNEFSVPQIDHRSK